MNMPKKMYGQGGNTSLDGLRIQDVAILMKLECVGSYGKKLNNFFFRMYSYCSSTSNKLQYSEDMHIKQIHQIAE